MTAFPPPRRLKSWLMTGVLLVCLFGERNQSEAIIFVSTGDADFNTTAPSGSLQDSGWQYEGSWGGYLGTAIAPNYFLAAKHIGGNVGDSFTFDGVSYTTTAVFDSPSSDLRLWRVNGTLP